MYYIMDFFDHRFVSFDTEEEIKTAINNLTNKGHNVRDLLVLTVQETDIQTADEFLDRTNPESGSKLFLVTDICWDTSDDDWNDDEDDDEDDLPSIHLVCVEDEERIADTLSDIFGFCVLSYMAIPVDENLIQVFPNLKFYACELRGKDTAGEALDEIYVIAAIRKPTNEEASELLSDEQKKAGLFIYDVKEMPFDEAMECYSFEPNTGYPVWGS